MIAALPAWGHSPRGPVGTAIVTSTHRQKYYLHAWWSPLPTTSIIGSEVMNRCYDFGVVRGIELGLHRQFDYFSANDEQELPGLYDDAYAFEKVGTMMVGPDHWLGYMMHSYGPNYDNDPRDWSGPVDCYLRKSSYPKDHWQFYRISDNVNDPVRGSQSYTINTWHTAPAEHWHWQAYYTNGICDKFSGWHCNVFEPVPMPEPSAPLMTAQALQDPLTETPQQVTMDNIPADGNEPMEVDADQQWCNCFPMRRAARRDCGVPMSEPLVNR